MQAGAGVPPRKRLPMQETEGQVVEILATPAWGMAGRLGLAGEGLGQQSVVRGAQAIDGQ